MAAPNPVNYSIFFPFWADLLRWWTQKMLVFTRFLKNRRSWRERNPVNNSSHFRGLKLWSLRGFLPSGNAKCCKLQHFVRCFCSIFKRAMLSPVLCILPQEQRCRLKLDYSVTRKKAGWRSRTEAFTHTGAFTQRSLYTKELFTNRRFYTEKSLL